VRRRLLALSMLLALSPLAVAAPEDPQIPADTEIQTTPSGLKYSVLQAGTGDVMPKMGDRVRVHYTGWFPDGKVFDSSRQRGAPAEFRVGDVIEGWNEALQLMTKGARWKLTIPGPIAYGASGRPPTIPPNATLIFDVELIEVFAMPAMPKFRAGNPEAQKKTASGLVYEVIREGAGEPPTAEDGFEMKFALWNAAGKLLEATERNGQMLVGRAQDFPLPFLGEAVRLMRPGARYRFEVPAALWFGERSPGPDLPAGSVSVWEFELLKVNRPMPVPEFALSAPGKATKQPSGLEIETLVEGTGASPKAGDHVLVHYAGWLTDGVLFDSSYQRGTPVKFRIGEVIPGWNEGLQRMKVGGKARLTIPGGIAYGPQGRPPKIGPNATLVFVVELLGVNP
jgi:FKBP-type peptidyl-prolyl cis-trans isomerase